MKTALTSTSNKTSCDEGTFLYYPADESTLKMEKFAEERDEIVVTARGDPSDADILKKRQE